MNNYFVILAAGKSKRFSKNLLKQFYKYKNKEIIDHSVEKALKSKLFKKIIIVSNNARYLKKKKYPKLVSIIKGGKERSDSSLNALKFIKKYKPKKVFIHDAARPNFSLKLLKNISKNLKKNKAVVPIVNSRDSIKYKVKNEVFNLNRKNSLLTQTPQAFDFKELYKLAIREKSKINDEATLFSSQNYRIKFIPGENSNNKITYLDDIKLSKTFHGLGFDIHRLVKNKKLFLGGAKIPFHSGLKGHSDGDVILHATLNKTNPAPIHRQKFNAVVDVSSSTLQLLHRKFSILFGDWRIQFFVCFNQMIHNQLFSKTIESWIFYNHLNMIWSMTLNDLSLSSFWIHPSFVARNVDFVDGTFFFWLTKFSFFGAAIRPLDHTTRCQSCCQSSTNHFHCLFVINIF